VKNIEKMYLRNNYSDIEGNSSKTKNANNEWKFKFVDYVFKGLYYVVIAYALLTMLGGVDMMKEKFKFEIKKAEEITTKLDDVKGIDEIKDEVLNIIKMLKNPEKYSEKGAKLHKGVMMFGEPGVGKTLLARAIAGEAGVNFIFTSGSNFDEMFVGTGAKRV
jgi:ATP-dependent metalloprotease